ncbi:hypothetical protein MKW94_026133 [Papaver nudicaule]|uniref:Uncharacterized protein n=1 Tax=Papaver nudicaule TaxID=74823 RepID=A0AA41S021_PAPNU|nr:hypothetical protein [Papaver nudicaule]
MIMESLDITKEQRGEATTDRRDGMIPELEDDEVIKILPPWMIMQGMNVTKDQRGEAITDHQDGMKSELEDDDEWHEWVDAPTTGMATETFKLHDLNVPAVNSSPLSRLWFLMLSQGDHGLRG